MSELRYKLDSLPRAEFDMIYATVLATAASRRRDIRLAVTLPTLVTDDVEQLPDSKQGYVRQSLDGTDHLNGCAWTGVGYIWLNPHRTAHEVRRTLMHELSHLLVSEENHGGKWRRLFGMSMVHYFKSVGLNDVIRNEVAFVVAAYHKQRSLCVTDYHNALRHEAQGIITAAGRQHKEVMEAVSEWMSEKETRSSGHSPSVNRSTGTRRTRPTSVGGVSYGLPGLHSSL